MASVDRRNLSIVSPVSFYSSVNNNKSTFGAAKVSGCLFSLKEEKQEEEEKKEQKCGHAIGSVCRF